MVPGGGEKDRMTFEKHFVSGRNEWKLGSRRRKRQDDFEKHLVSGRKEDIEEGYS